MQHNQLAIIGAGTVGQALASAFSRHGLPVTLGVTDPARYAAVAATLNAAPTAAAAVRLSTTAAAIQDADTVILAVPHAATGAIAHSLPDWQNRILVDATNPLAPGLTGLSIGGATSGAEALARLAHGARVVKAFNTTGAENMADSTYPQGRLCMPVAGDDPAARSSICALAERIGFEAIDMGGLHTARYLEPLAMVWIHLAIKQGQGRRFGLALLRR